MQLEGIASAAFWSSSYPTMPAGESEAIAQTLCAHERAQERTPSLSADFAASLFSSDAGGGIDEEFNWLQSNRSASSSDASGFFDTTTSFEDYFSPLMDLCATQDHFNEAFGGAAPPSPCLPADEFVTRTSDRKRRSSAQTGGGQIAGPQKKARSSLSISSISNKTEEEESNEESSSCCSSEIELNAPKPTPKGPKKGSAADVQCLYARKRRERINERLRMLQNLVPNGTKVQISTMLEEAARYVKFLHLQIKLLSSDELWMYAPVAYDGMSI